MGDIEACMAAVDFAFSIIIQNEPTTFYTFFGYAHIVEVMLLIFKSVQTQQSSFLTKPKAQVKAEKALAAFGKFSKAFPMAVPRVELWNAFYHLLNGRNTKSDKCATKAFEAAQKLGMKYEMALILYERSRWKKSEALSKEAEKLIPFILTRGHTLDVLKRNQNKASKILGKKN